MYVNKSRKKVVKGFVVALNLKLHHVTFERREKIEFNLIKTLSKFSTLRGVAARVRVARSD